METLDYCELCEQDKVCSYEIPSGDYVCQDCYEGLADRAEAQWESQQETEAGGN